jgi:hypothetical protein
MRLILATRAFFAVISNRSRATQIEELLKGKEKATTPTPPTLEGPKQPAQGTTSQTTTTPPKGAKQGRSDALTLLSTLQRDARFLDLVSESLDQYSDAQIGAAARDVLRDTKKSLDKMLGIKPLVDDKEGESVTLPEKPSPIRWKLMGSNATKGVLTHPGWTASKVELPTWTGSTQDSLVLSAAEVDT